MTRLLAIFLLFAFPALAAEPVPRCDNPKIYGLLASDKKVGHYCWEVKYMKEWGASSITYGKKPVADEALLRRSGITPEKAEYLAEHFADDTYTRAFCNADRIKRDKELEKVCGGGNVPLEWRSAAGKSDKDALDIIMARANLEMGRFRAEYDIDYVPATGSNPEAGMYAVARAPLVGEWKCSGRVKTPTALRIVNSAIWKLFGWGARPALIWANRLIDRTSKEEATADADRRINEMLGTSDIKGFNSLPDYIGPAGVIGQDFVNAFGERVGYIDVKDGKFGVFLGKGGKHDIKMLDGTRVGYWDSAICNITDFRSVLRYVPLQDIGSSLRNRLPGSDGYNCTSCRMFELAFNTVSRIAFFLYDDISSYALMFLAGVLALWALWQFFAIVIRDRKSGEEFVKAYWTRFIWLAMIAGFMSVSITSEFNIFRYTLVPVTSFMNSFVRHTTGILDTASGGGGHECRYERLTYGEAMHAREMLSPQEIHRLSPAEIVQYGQRLQRHDKRSSQMMFPPEVRSDIVCSIERIADFNHFITVIARLSLGSGGREISNGEWGSGMAKIVLALGIMALFFFINLAIPFYFIESIFRMGVIVLLLPLILGAYAFEKTKGLIKTAWGMFFSAVMQVVFLSLICLVIVLLFMYLMGADLENVYGAFASGDPQMITSHIVYMLSFDAAGLLEIFYVGILAWYLVGKAVDYAAEFGSGNSISEMAKTFVGWQKNAVLYFVSVSSNKAVYANTTKALENRARKDRKEGRA